ncbi:MAG: LuxR family transcriptional regulator [Hydrogenophaga sp.]|jgi:DNA-binding CsgD family transcriptional regulator|uniref:helix-turn-helix transcriptional regulator n=1 Tax=Hydrogenophaga sp. TaxID=1904254 RepID=UPI0025B80A70|nr:LuxR family transcriptional regulator [Hydrogenophaga sp.]MDO8889096.1 LuxR family transcriptional regulator [Hydrogenophaga sp.]MDO9507194.1 LuxR family transcriptional regulator [Hydrogenophaga sp.]MDP2076319.1 LuxR family transcriptional regulator [Hydrogenophaga sp.]MDP2250278.1 LuxR family transcriptional regulator [Hydrogenophaga sp.]MDP2987081.1 LuxR family transcriptional regulator [Hydrogenophaga sp.]
MSGQPVMGRAHLLRVLDEVDYGVLIIDAQGTILHANHLARHELASGRMLMSYGNSLLGSSAEFTSQMQTAMEAAFRGQRRLVLLNKGERELSLAFTPLSHPLEADTPTVLVMLSRQSACDNLAVRMFARTIGLSPSEEAVLMGLCRGLEIPEIAAEHGVAPSTIRSQIKTLREKAGSPSIRRLLQRINSLPPVVPALRIVMPMPHNAAESIHP